MTPLSPDQIRVRDAVAVIRRLMKPLPMELAEAVGEQCDTIDRIVWGPRLVVDEAGTAPQQENTHG